ncbi:MAG: sulfotransferase [Acidimicrobiales bacterium]|nr:sulfotransferase [Acidimicrobiales bacterium]
MSDEPSTDPAAEPDAAEADAVTEADAATEESEPAGHAPTFVIIGAQKSATRWLRLNLGQHPDVYTAPLELRFFNDGPTFRQGREWYARQFSGWDGEAHVGEATPGYMIWRHTPSVVATRMRRFDPALKLIAILRNPIDRAYSGLVHHLRRERLPADTDLLTYVRSKDPEKDRLCLVTGGWYAASLQPFKQRFAHRLLVLLHDDVNANPRGVYEQALAHIGADPSFVPPELAEVRFSNTPPKQSGLRRQQGSGYRQLTVAQRYQLWDYFAEDVAKLEQMLDRDLSMWRPAEPPT